MTAHSLNTILLATCEMTHWFGIAIKFYSSIQFGDFVCVLSRKANAVKGCSRKQQLRRRKRQERLGAISNSTCRCRDASLPNGFAESDCGHNQDLIVS